MDLLTVFARKEPTTDDVAIKHGLRSKKDTVFYRDPECKRFFARKPWHQSGHPTRVTKKVTLNCFVWVVKWVDPQILNAKRIGNNDAGGV